MMIVTSSAAIVVVATQEFQSQKAETKKPSPKQGNTYFSDIVATRDRELLDQFMATLNPTIMQECAAEHDLGHTIDLDYLASCGDFDLYAKYLRISKFEAVKKFEYVMLYSSSKLEFEERLAR
ncbi:hypothetical protein CGZ80_15605 [Rhodopirellula sp. MGV]|nr:hypothetical protein CGZ80_15605 [Rhodopirellula sp. MGV]